MTSAPMSASIIVGTNLGYGLNHLLVNTPDTHKVLVIEPNPVLVLACLQFYRLTRGWQDRTAAGAPS